MPVVEVAVGGVSFRAEEHDDAAYGRFWASFGSGSFEPATVELLRRHVGPGSTVLDGGAWIGPFTLLAAALGATVVAFEPDPVARAQLLANLACNPLLAGRVEVRPEALAATTGRRPFGSPTVGLGNGRSLLASRTRWRLGTPTGTGTEVDTIDARQVDLGGVDVVKLDLEGGEFEVLPRLAAPLRRHRPVLLLSVHGREPATTRATRLVRRLRSVPDGVRLLRALRGYPAVARIVDNRTEGWVWLRRHQRALLPFRLGEYELLASPVVPWPARRPRAPA